MDPHRGARAVLSAILTVAETGSTNADMLGLAASGAADGLWLCAERQTAGRGRLGRDWVSPLGNLYASHLVRLRPGDSPAPTLALMAAVALADAVSDHLSSPFRASGAPSLSRWEREGARPAQPGWKGEGSTGDQPHVVLKWPNDLLIDGAKLSGILLERSGDAVVIGIGVNLAHHPVLPDRPTTSLAAHGIVIAPDTFLEDLAETMRRWLAVWRGEGLASIIEAWLSRAHPIGTALTARLPDGGATDGTFDGLDDGGALILRLADGGRRVIHAADVFLV